MSGHKSYSTNHDELVSLNSLIGSFEPAAPDITSLQTMDLNQPNVRNFINALNRHNVKYMLVGGLATAIHGYVRGTKDLDLWIQDNPTNKDRLIAALKDINVPSADRYRNIDMIPGWRLFI